MGGRKPTSTDKPEARRAAKPRAKQATGAPSKFTQSIANRICSRLADGESLRSICTSKGFPTKTTVLRWLADKRYAAFRDQYTHARELQADSFVDDMIDIADDTSNDTIDTEAGERANTEWISRSRLRIDTRKWIAARMAPKKYGDKLEVGGQGEGGAIVVNIRRFSDTPATRDANA